MAGGRQRKALFSTSAFHIHEYTRVCTHILAHTAHKQVRIYRDLSITS